MGYLSEAEKPGEVGKIFSKNKKNLLEKKKLEKGLLEKKKLDKIKLDKRTLYEV